MVCMVQEERDGWVLEQRAREEREVPGGEREEVVARD